MRTVAAALAAVLLVGAPQVIRARDSGKTFRLAVGREVHLRLSHRTWTWSNVKASSRSVKLTRIVFVRDPGYDEWLVRGRAKGRAKISATGQIPCRTSPCPPTPLRLFAVTLVVG
jgi:hypothetical protein